MLCNKLRVPSSIMFRVVVVGEAFDEGLLDFETCVIGLWKIKDKEISRIIVHLSLGPVVNELPGQAQHRRRRAAAAAAALRVRAPRPGVSARVPGDGGGGGLLAAAHLRGDRQVHRPHRQGRARRLQVLLLMFSFLPVLCCCLCCCCC